MTPCSILTHPHYVGCSLLFGQTRGSAPTVGCKGIAIFSVDPSTGLLTRVGYQPTAAHPRQFNITPNGEFLLCCCRDSNKIQVFRRNKNTGALSDTGKDIPVSRAVCVQFL